MKFISICSGIEAATVAWAPLGWEPRWFSEIDPHANAVLKARHPEVPNLGDITRINGADHGTADLVVGGTPCQSFSVAGLRAGLDDDRGNLAFEFLRLVGEIRPRWVVWENVPGVLSSLSHDAPDIRPPDIDLDGPHGPEDWEEVVVEDRYDSDENHAFSCFLAGLSELGYGFAYRLLDAQWVRVQPHPRAVPQRRRRVFVLGYLGDWRPPAAVLLEREGLPWHPAPRREAGKADSRLTAKGVGGGGGLGTDSECGGGVAGTLDADYGKQGGTTHQAIAAGLLLHEITPPLTHKPYGDNPAQTGILIAEVAPTLNAEFSTKKGLDDQHIHSCQAGLFVPFDTTQITSKANRSNPKPGDPCHPLTAGGNPPSIAEVAHTLRGEGHDASEDGTGRGTPLIAMQGNASEPIIAEDGEAPTLDTKAAQVAVAFQSRASHTNSMNPDEVAPTLDVGKGEGIAVVEVARTGGRLESEPDALVAIQERAVAENLESGPEGKGFNEEGVAYTLESRNKSQAVAGTLAGVSRARGWQNSADSAAAGHMVPEGGYIVRRITPIEGERIMGFEDDYTLVPFRGKPMADGPRYRLLGNSICINVLRWLGERIQMCEEILEEIDGAHSHL